MPLDSTEPGTNTPAPAAAVPEPADALALAELAAVPELAGVTAGSPDHLDLVGKAMLAMHARVSQLETYVKHVMTELEGVPLRVFHE